MSGDATVRAPAHDLVQREDSVSLIIGPEQGEHIVSLASLATIKIPAKATGGAFSVTLHVVPPQGGPPPHTHPETEVIYVADGTFDVVVGEERTTVGAGTILHVPPGTPHTTRNVGERAGTQVSFYMPGGGEGFFREIGTAIAGPGEAPDLDRPANMAGVDMARVRELTAKYGMVIVPPDTSAAG